MALVGGLFGAIASGPYWRSLEESRELGLPDLELKRRSLECQSRGVCQSRGIWDFRKSTYWSWSLEESCVQRKLGV